MNGKAPGTLVDLYALRYPHEHERLSKLREFLRSAPVWSEACSRNQQIGHITASAVVLCRSSRRVLLVQKPAWSRPLQPGGHILPGTDASPLAGAKRHLEWRLPEAFTARLEYIAFDYDPLIPLDIDTHAVPLSTQDNEPPHLHFDFRYVFFGEANELSLDDERSARHRPEWCDLNYLKALSTFHHLVAKLHNLGMPEMQRRRFFALVQPPAPDDRARPNTIAVAHIIPDIPEYLRALREFSDVRAVFAKPRSVDHRVLGELRSEPQPVRVMQFNRGDKGLVEALHAEVADAPGPVVLIDIGGWFAGHLAALVAEHGDKVLGVVEDTENGLQKYQDAEPLPVPVCSVARSPLKDYEDFLIGQSVVFSADAIMRGRGTLLQYCKCGVVGFGKIGKSIAQHLRERGVRPIVYEKRPIRRLEAYNRGCMTPNFGALLSESEVLFSATGARALSLDDFRQLRNGCSVFSVTSSDDEFDDAYLRTEYEVAQVGPHVDRYTGPQNTFDLVQGGNAVNFIHGAVVGEFIHLVRAEMISAAASVHKRERPGLYELEMATREGIAEAWLRVFLGVRA